MKNKFLRLIIFLLFIIYSTLSQAQENSFNISGQYRVRPELRNGYRTLATDSSIAAFFIGQRARLIFDYKKDKISSKISIQDSRTFGDEEQKKDNAGLHVNELWFQLALSKEFAIKMGRQELNYDDQRLLGNSDWGSTTISHDAILLKYENKEQQLQYHIGGAFNQSGEPLFGTKYQLNNYKVLALAWLKKEISIRHSVSAIAIANGLTATTNPASNIKTSLTFGPLYNFHHNGWKLVLGGYYQTGKTETDLKINAAMLNAYAEKTIKKISIGAGLDYLTGNNDNTKVDESNNFSTLYPTNHKFYGTMDYFLNIPADTKGRGLRDAYLRIKAKASDKFSAGIDIHSFALAHKNFSGLNTIDKNLGAELDVTTDYTPFPDVVLQVGYANMFASKNMQALKGGDKNSYQYWAYVMLKVSPVFFKQVFKN